MAQKPCRTWCFARHLNPTPNSVPSCPVYTTMASWVLHPSVRVPTPERGVEHFMQRFCFGPGAPEAMASLLKQNGCASFVNEMGCNCTGMKVTCTVCERWLHAMLRIIRDMYVRANPPIGMPWAGAQYKYWVWHLYMDFLRKAMKDGLNVIAEEQRTPMPRSDAAATTRTEPPVPVQPSSQTQQWGEAAAMSESMHSIVSSDAICESLHEPTTDDQRASEITARVATLEKHLKESLVRVASIEERLAHVASLKERLALLEMRNASTPVLKRRYNRATDEWHTWKVEASGEWVLIAQTPAQGA